MSGEEIYDLLDSLGGTAEIVANRLRAEGVKGTPCESDLCVLAEFLRRNGVNDPWVVPGAGREDGARDRGYVDVVGIGAIDLPPACNRLASEFDDMLHPDLVSDP